MKKAALLLGLLATGTGSAFARDAEAPYVGFDYLMTTFKTSDADLQMDAARVRVGTEFNPYFGVEYQGAIGLGGDSAKVVGGSISTELKGITGVYLRAKVPLGEAASVYAIGGFSWAWIKIDPTVFGLMGQTAKESGASAGAGVEISGPGSSFLSAEYIEYTKGLTAIAAGLRIPL